MTPLRNPLKREVIIGSRQPTVYVVTMDRSGITLRVKGKRKAMDTIPWGKIETISGDITGRRILAERKAARAERKLGRRGGR